MTLIKGMTGPKAVLQASQNDESFIDSIEDLIDEYLELIFPSEDTSETMQLIELMTSRDPDSKIRAIVATEGGYDPCADDKTEDALYKRHSGHKTKAKILTSSMHCGPRNPHFILFWILIRG